MGGLLLGGNLEPQGQPISRSDSISTNREVEERLRNAKNFHPDADVVSPEPLTDAELLRAAVTDDRTDLEKRLARAENVEPSQN